MFQPLSIIADQQILFAEEVFSQFGQVKLVDGRAIDNATIKDADVLLVRSVTKVNETLLKDSTIRFVGSATSGIDHIDTDYLQNANIHFVHSPGSNARSVAEYVLSSLFAAAEFKGFDLTEKTVGIIGCGQVGTSVKQFMQALGIKCLVNDPLLAEKNPDDDYVELDRIVEADIITLHVPLTRAGQYPTYKIINQSFLDRLKADVVLLNTARGEAIDEVALLAFKETHPAATLILDVWCNEPQINIDLLQQAFIGTPHIAGYSYDGKLKATRMLAEAMAQAFKHPFDDSMSVSEPVLDPVEYNDNSAIQSAVMRSYDVRSDAITLRESVDMPVDERARYFDGLRKKYPIRREFTQRVINTNKLNESMRQQLSDLGFKADK